MQGSFLSLFFAAAGCHELYCCAPPTPPITHADGIVLGLHNSLSGECIMNPPPERRLRRGDAAVLLHPGR